MVLLSVCVALTDKDLSQVLTISMHLQTLVSINCIFHPWSLLQLQHVWCSRCRPYTVSTFHLLTYDRASDEKLTIATETFGEKFHTSLGISLLTYVQRYDPLLGMGILQSDFLMFLMSFPLLLLLSFRQPHGEPFPPLSVIILGFASLCRFRPYF